MSQSRNTRTKREQRNSKGHKKGHSVFPMGSTAPVVDRPLGGLRRLVISYRAVGEACALPEHSWSSGRYVPAIILAMYARICRLCENGGSRDMMRIPPPLMTTYGVLRPRSRIDR